MYVCAVLQSLYTFEKGKIHNLEFSLKWKKINKCIHGVLPVVPVARAAATALL